MHLLNSGNPPPCDDSDHAGQWPPSDGLRPDDRFRRSAEARDSTDGLPLTVRERSFVLRPLDGEVCPISALPLRWRPAQSGGKLTFIGDLDGRALSVRPDATSTSGTSRVNAQIGRASCR